MQEQKILIAAHRGAAGANIPCNSLASFEAALFQGADILEMDVIRTTDGALMVFHNTLEAVYLGEQFDIYQADCEKVRSLVLRNSDHGVTTHQVPMLEEVLEQFKGRCLINLDRCWKLWEHILPVIERHGMRDQILLKSPPEQTYFDKLAEIGPNYAYMPIFKDNLDGLDALEAANVHHWGSELVFFTEDAPVMPEASLERLRKGGKKLWSNSLLYSYKAQLAAGHSDDVSLAGNPDQGWGWLADQGFDVIQTDWPGLLALYLSRRGLHTPPM